MKASSMAELAALVRQRGWTLCSCESCTGGLFASKLTEMPGVSAFFKGAVVTYWTAMKIDMEDKPAGMICTAIHVPGQTWTATDLLTGTRQEVREQIVQRVAERSSTFLRQIW